jgi:uncharacterized membrane protein
MHPGLSIIASFALTFSKTKVHMSVIIQTSIDLNVSVQTAYQQWTRFGEFPRFMEGVKEVYQHDDRHLHWTTEIPGYEKEWDAEITDQTPNERIAWRSRASPITDAIVTFYPDLDDTSTVQLQIAFNSLCAIDNGKDELEALSLRVARDLQQFKVFIESQCQEN